MTISPSLRNLLSGGGSVCVLTGAGISAESGVPTFRSKDGIWSRFRPEELASIEGFMKNPALVLEWYAQRRAIVRTVHPNAGHDALVRMEQSIPDFTIATQNVDNLHARAGSKNVLELHGNIERDRCMDCGSTDSPAAPGDARELPRCRHCHGLLRPDVVWFGEELPVDAFQKAELAAKRSSLFLCVGTSAIVYPAASLPAIARSAGSYVVEINVERTEISSTVDEVLTGKAGDILPALASVVQSSRVGV